MVVRTSFRALRPSGQTYGLFRAISSVFWGKFRVSCKYRSHKYVVMSDVGKQQEEEEL
jgi:hypothetical protein